MKAVCHIGHHKTGTTTLQSFLAQNSFRLLTCGILYPWSESEGSALAMRQALSAAAGGEARPALLPINFRETHNALAFRMLSDALPSWKVPSYHRNLPHSRQMLITIRNQIETLCPDQIVLCSEVMSHFGKIAPAEIARLRKEALAAAQQFTLWCTLRRPDEQLVSWHGQQVRFGQSPAPLSDTEHGLNLKWLHVDYRGVIEPWLTQIPEAEPVLRPYRETLAAGGSVEDFLTTGGFDLPDGLIPAQTMNVSFKPAVISLLRLANRELPQPLAHELAHQSGALTEGMKLAATSEVEFLGPESRAKLIDHFGPIHEWLSQISGRTAFFTDIDEMATCRPLPETAALQALLDQLTADRIARITAPDIRDFLTRLCAQGAAA